MQHCTIVHVTGVGCRCRDPMSAAGATERAECWEQLPFTCLQIHLKRHSALLTMSVSALPLSSGLASMLEAAGGSAVDQTLLLVWQNARSWQSPRTLTSLVLPAGGQGTVAKRQRCAAGAHRRCAAGAHAGAHAHGARPARRPSPGAWCVAAHVLTACFVACTLALVGCFVLYFYRP